MIELCMQRDDISIDSSLACWRGVRETDSTFRYFLQPLIKSPEGQSPEGDCYVGMVLLDPVEDLCRLWEG